MYKVKRYDIVDQGAVYSNYVYKEIEDGILCKSKDVKVVELKLGEAISIFEKMSCEDLGIGINTDIDNFLNSITTVKESSNEK